jgi:hypothetical protein
MLLALAGTYFLRPKNRYLIQYFNIITRMKKNKTIISKKELEKKVKEQFALSIELGYFTQEEVDKHFKDKKKIKKKPNHKRKKPIIYLGYNTISK